MTRRYVIIVPWGEVADANARADQFDPDTGGDLTFGRVELSADGADPPSHSACNTLMSDKVWDGVEPVLTDLVYTVHIYRTDDRVSTPSSSVKRYDSGSWVSVGQGDVFEVALSDAALTRIVTELV